MIDNSGLPDQDDSLAAMLCAALDGAAADPVRLHLLTALFLFTNPDRETDLDRMRREGPSPVYKM